VTVVREHHSRHTRHDAAPIEDQVRRIGGRIDPATGTLDAESYQSLTRKDTPFDRALKSKDPNVRFYAGQLREALGALPMLSPISNRPATNGRS
jgi:hypothetical protein